MTKSALQRLKNYNTTRALRFHLYKALYLYAVYGLESDIDFPFIQLITYTPNERYKRYAIKKRP